MASTTVGSLVHGWGLIWPVVAKSFCLMSSICSVCRNISVWFSTSVRMVLSTVSFFPQDNPEEISWSCSPGVMPLKASLSSYSRLTKFVLLSRMSSSSVPCLVLNRRREGRKASILNGSTLSIAVPQCSLTRRMSAKWVQSAQAGPV